MRGLKGGGVGGGGSICHAEEAKGHISKLALDSTFSFFLNSI